MAWTVSDTTENSDFITRMERGFRALGGSEVAWGWTEESADYEDGTDVIEIAVIHNFGTDRIPARPILAESFERNIDQINVTAEAINDSIIDRGVNDIEPALRVIGQFAQSNLQQDFLRAQGELTPLADSTIAKKGHSLRLIETGHLRSQVKFRVNTGD